MKGISQNRGKLPRRFLDRASTSLMTETWWKTVDRSDMQFVMEMDFKTFAERSHYRVGSSVLISIFGVAFALVLIGVPAWLFSILGLVPAIALIIITYHRLRNADLSSAWLLLMILEVRAGPTWTLSEHMTVSPVGLLLSLVPVILGWFVPASIDRKTTLTTV